MFNDIDFGALPIDEMKITNEFLVLGCSECETIYGRVDLFDRSTHELLGQFTGDGEHLYNGRKVEAMDTVPGKLAQIFYESAQFI